MASHPEAAEPRPLALIGTTLARARCRHPARVERMKQSLAAHGQLLPVVAVKREERLELVDGFKRRAAAEALGWPTLVVTVARADETAQWVTMLLLNQGPRSMTEVEEALVLRELTRLGLTQIQVGALVGRHKSWVSRRIGLVERLHHELIEAMKVGLLHPGVARRLLALPPGNQLEMAAVAQKHGLGPRDTELLISLWQKTKDPKIRRALIADPRKAILNQSPAFTRSPVDPRLQPQGQRLQRSLHLLQRLVHQTTSLLRPAPGAEDLEILSKDLRRTARGLLHLATELGSLDRSKSGPQSEESAATA